MPPFPPASPPSPLPPPPSAPVYPIPEGGVEVLDGLTGEALGCLLPDRDENTTTFKIGGVTKTIAAQCCLTNITSRDACRRYIGTEDDDGCIGGKPARPFTWAENAAKCAQKGIELDLPLGMCAQDCGKKGCGYNKLPVFTNKP